MNPYLQISNLTKCFGRTQALENLNLGIDRGSVLALLGPNGAGKSTLFGCLLGLSEPTSGSTHYEGRPISESDRARFGYVAERVSLYPQRTVMENAAFFVRLKGGSSVDMQEQLRRVGLQHVSQRKVRQLSKGMLQRLGLALALCGQPELLILDEPFNGLDPALLGTLQTILREENDRGATLLISTHTMSAIEPIATHAALLLRGKLAAFGTLDALRDEQGNDALEAIYHRIARQHHEPEEILV